MRHGKDIWYELQAYRKPLAALPSPPRKRSRRISKKGKRRPPGNYPTASNYQPRAVREIEPPVFPGWCTATVDRAAYMKSQEWHELRRLILDRDSWRCVDCKRDAHRGLALHVHHLHYRTLGF